MIAATATNAASPLEIPTYDTSGQVVHPSVVDAGAGKWNGYRYWMAMTPYPNSNDNYENPSIVVSDDKTTWIVPPGLTNPVVPEPTAPAYNSDSDIYLHTDGKMYMVYRFRTADDTTDILYMKESSDGINWSADVEIMRDATNKFQSPSILHDGTKWLMYYNYITAGHDYYRTYAFSPYGPWSTPVKLQGSIGNPSHIDVIRDNAGVFYAIMHNNSNQLFFALSFDGIWWYPKNTAILSPSGAGGWDDTGFYRASIVRTASGFDMWYTGKGSATDWRIGYTTITPG